MIEIVHHVRAARCEHVVEDSADEAGDVTVEAGITVEDGDVGTLADAIEKVIGYPVDGLTGAFGA